MKNDGTEKNSGTQDNVKFDLVCGMYLDDYPDLKSAEKDGKTYRFCGEGCAERFRKNPDRFSGEPVLRLHGVFKTFFFAGGAKTEVLKDVNLNIWKGDFVAIVGASGSGKSTILNMIGLLDRPTSGKVFVKGKDSSKMADEERAGLRSRTFGFVFQQYNLIPWLSVYDNVSLPSIFSGKNSDKEAVLEKIKKVGLGERIFHKPMELSGGEQQRVAILRALANDPEIIIGDEPTGNLDSKTGKEILEMLIELNKKMGKILIVVTHDLDIADKADEIVVVKDGMMMRDQRIHKREYAD